MREQLDKYLSEVESRLRPMPAEARQAELEELKQHLLQLIEVKKRHGCNEHDATMMAIRQFGSAKKIARGLNNAVPYQKMGLGYILAALTVFVSIQILTVVLGFFIIYSTLSLHTFRIGDSAVAFFFVIWPCAITPLFAGYACDRLYPRYSLPICACVNGLLLAGWFGRDIPSFLACLSVLMCSLLGVGIHRLRVRSKHVIAFECAS